jgi:hypothetical protein
MTGSQKNGRPLRPPVIFWRIRVASAAARFGTARHRACRCLPGKVPDGR